MTEAEWLECSYPSEMLIWLTPLNTSERKVLLLLVAVWNDRSDDYSQETKAIRLAMDRFVEGIISRDELDQIYRANGAENGAPIHFTTEDSRYWIATSKSARNRACRLIRDIFGNPFRPVTFSPEWRTSTAVALAQQMYESRDFSAMPILADALQDAGCDNDDVLNHCRDEKQTHVRGCWVVDLVLGKG